MNQLDRTPEERSRRIEGHLLHLIAERTQTAIAQEMGIDDSTFHRWINGESGLKRCAQLLAILGLSIGRNDTVYAKEYVDALVVLARTQLGKQ